jgi:hypothetical protein
MPALSDARFDALRALGYTGATNDMILQWLQANGATSPALPDAWMEMLLFQADGAFTGGQRNDRWYTLLALNGFLAKDINQRELDFWLAGGTFTPIPNLYVNPELAGGVDNTSPPTAHTLAFGPLDYVYEDQGDGTFKMHINQGASAGRLMLQYSLVDNNPDLVLQNLYRVSWDVRAENSGTFVLGLNGFSNVTIRQTSRFPVVGEWATVSYQFTPDLAGYTGNFRVGVGPTNTQEQGLEIRRPRLIDLGPVSNFSPGFDDGFY